MIRMFRLYPFPNSRQVIFFQIINLKGMLDTYIYKEKAIIQAFSDSFNYFF